MQAAGFLAAVKSAVRCARRLVVVDVHPACALLCAFVAVTVHFPTCTICFRAKNNNAYEQIHSPHVPHIIRAYIAQEKSRRREVRCIPHAVSNVLIPLPGARVASIFPPLGIVFDPYAHDKDN